MYREFLEGFKRSHKREVETLNAQIDALLQEVQSRCGELAMAMEAMEQEYLGEQEVIHLVGAVSDLCTRGSYLCKRVMQSGQLFIISVARVRLATISQILSFSLAVFVCTTEYCQV